MNNLEYRYDIINFLSDVYYDGKASYLEIGVEYPDSCFNRIRASHKTSVDPQKVKEGVHIDYHMTSDEFFTKLHKFETEFKPDKIWDIIFIDGLHLADQVYRDIQNSVLHCGGFVVLHDCAPPNFWNAHSDYEFFKKNQHEWNGSTWKAFYKYRTETNKKTYTINTDYGVGVIEIKNQGPSIRHDNPWFEYGMMKSNMKKYLGLVSIDEFRKMHSNKNDFDWWNWRFENEDGIDYRP